MKQHIQEDFYKKIVSAMPIVGVDVVVEYQGGILLVKRSEEPSKGKWWFPGGRMLKYEHPEKTAERKVREETGLDCKIRKLLGVDTTNSERWPGTRHFSVHIVYHAEAWGKVKTDKTSSEWRVFRKTDPKWHRYVRRFAKESRIVK